MTTTSKQPKIALRVTGPDGLSKEVVLSQDNAIVGSGPSATIQLIDAKVSAVHFLLKLGKTGELTMLDLGSEAGTRLKGQLIKEPTKLATGDVIQVGGSTIKVAIGDGEGTDIVEIAAAVDDSDVHEDTAGAEVQEPTTNPGTPNPGGLTTGAGPSDTVKARALSEPSPDRDPQKPSPSEPRAKPDEAPAAAVVSINKSPKKTEERGSRADVALSSFQDTSLRAPAFALGPNGNKLLNEEFANEEKPTAQARRLEVALLWGDTVIDVRLFGPDGVVRVGPSPAADFRVYDDGVGESFELAAKGVVKAPPAASLAVYRDGKNTRASGNVTLDLEDRALVSLGTTHFIVRWILPVAETKTGVFDSVDFYFTKVLSVAFMAHLILLIGFWITPLNNDLLSEDLFKNPSQLVKTIIKAPVKQKKFDLSGVKEGAKAKDKEGKFGKKEAKKPEAAPSKKGAPIVDAKKREEDRKKIMNSGLLSGLHGPDGAVSNVFGPGGLGTGLNNALGGLQGGAGMGDAHGVGGLGSRGAGAGGGGTALGIGGLGTKGNGHGRGGYGNIDLGGRGKGDTRIIPGRTIVQGSLSKDVIAAIIRKHQNEIKYCYEVELNKHPDLYGKISVSFTIDGTGDVSEANVGETTMNNTSVENCMTTKIRRWKFPEPKGGGQVFVTYPWVFKASGTED